MQPLILLYHVAQRDMVERIAQTLDRPIEPIDVSENADPAKWTETLARFEPERLANAPLLTLLDDDSFRALWQTLADRDVTLMPLPWQNAPLTKKGFRLPDEAPEVYAKKQLAQSDEASFSRRHALIVDDERFVLHTLSIGPLDRGRPSMLRAIQQWRAHPEDFRLHAYTIETAKGRRIACACLHILVGEESVLPLPEEPSPPYPSGKLCARLEAPRGFFQLIQRHLFDRRSQSQNGWIVTDALTLSSDRPIAYYWNDQRLESAETLKLQARPTVCRVIAGEPLSPDTRDKEVVRIQNLPTAPETVKALEDRPLPLFPIADEAAFASLFSQLRQQARFDTSFGVLLTLSVLIATFGLFQNASPVIIGAMVLAPLMAPIISLSMGALRMDRSLALQSLKTLSLGVALAIGLSTLLTMLFPHVELTEQIDSRTHPNLLDLWVAIFSGIAAAYVHARQEIMQNLAGVAIAVALVPPLAVAGIGLGMEDGKLFSGAFLLFLANLVGILFAASVTFYVLGFASLKMFRVAFIWKALLLLGMAALLASLPA